MQGLFKNKLTFFWRVIRINKNDVRLAKKKILKCLTQDFPTGKASDQKQNQAIFDKETGIQNFNGTDLEMVMEAVVKGLYFAMRDSKNAEEGMMAFCQDCDTEVRAKPKLVGTEEVLCCVECSNKYIHDTHVKSKVLTMRNWRNFLNIAD